MVEKKDIQLFTMIYSSLILIILEKTDYAALGVLEHLPSNSNSVVSARK